MNPRLPLLPVLCADGSSNTTVRKVTHGNYLLLIQQRPGIKEVPAQKASDKLTLSFYSGCIPLSDGFSSTLCRRNSLRADQAVSVGGRGCGTRTNSREQIEAFQVFGTAPRQGC